MKLLFDSIVTYSLEILIKSDVIRFDLYNLKLTGKCEVYNVRKNRLNHNKIDTLWAKYNPAFLDGLGMERTERPHKPPKTSKSVSSKQKLATLHGSTVTVLRKLLK